MKKLLMILFVLLIFACHNEKTGKVIFRVSNIAEPSSLDPQLSTDVYGSNIIRNLFLGLTTGDSKTGGYKPGLAESWDISQDGKTYTFHLRDGLVWSDGVSITAEGIRKSYLRILDKKTSSEYVDLVKSTIFNGQEYFDSKVGENELGIKAIDKMTIEIKLVAPKPYFPDMLTHASLIPVPVHAIEKYGKEWTKPENMVTSGAYKLKKRIVNEQIVIEKNPLYFNADKVKIDEVVFFPVEGVTAYSMYLNNEIDFLQSMLSEKLDEAKLRDDYYSSQKNALAYIAFNLNVKPFDNVKVRQALTLAIDRKKLTEVVVKGGATPTRNASPDFDHYSYGKSLVLFDTENAKKLLTEAGYPNGEEFPKIVYKHVTSDGAKKVAEFLQSQWKENLNIEVVLQSEEWTTFLGSTRNGNYEMRSMGWMGDYADPSTFLESLFTSPNEAFGACGFRNAKYDELIKQSGLEQNPSKRQELLRQAEFMIVEELFPVAPISIPKSHFLFRNTKWEGWIPNVSDKYHYEDIMPK